MRHPYDGEQLESMRRWLREKDDENRRLRDDLDRARHSTELQITINREQRQAHDAEIERLRGLLAEPLSLYKMDFDEYAKWLNDWEKRVREALGE